MIRGIWMVRQAGLSALVVFLRHETWGVAPGWYGAAPLALPICLRRRTWVDGEGGVRRNVGSGLGKSISHVGFVELDAVFFQEHAKFALKAGMGPRRWRAIGVYPISSFPLRVSECGGIGIKKRRDEASIARHRPVGSPFAEFIDSFGHEDGEGAGLLDFGQQVGLGQRAVLGVGRVHGGDDGLFEFGAGETIRRG